MQLTYYNEWNNHNYQLFFEELFQYSDKKYLEFNKKIIFTQYKMIGIRIPDIRKIAKKISETDFESFLNCNFMGCYEELLLRGILISYFTEFNKFILYFDDFVKLIDNWAICDTCLASYKFIKNNRDKFLDKIKEYIFSNKEFITRVGVIFLLYYYLTDDYIDEVFILISDIKIRKYYVDMAIAWLISVAFVKNTSETIKFLDNNNLNDEIIKMAIQKIRDSRKVSKSLKDFVLKYKK